MRTFWVVVFTLAILAPVLLLAPASALRLLTDSAPSIEVSPASMSFDVVPDGTHSANLTITNRGTAPLHYTIDPTPVAGTMKVPSQQTASSLGVHAADWTAPSVPGRLIVGLKLGAAATQISSLHKQLGTTVIQSFELISAQVVEVKKGADLRTVAESYAKNPQVAYAEPDYMMQWCRTPNDPRSLTWLSVIAADHAWDIATGSDGITVAVLDSGLDVTHPDLEANVWTNPGEIAGNGVDDDHNGFVDDVHGWNFWDNNPDLTDIFGHGTHVSGIIGAVGNNGIGLAGLNWKVKLLMTKWGNDHEGPTSMMISCLQYAVRMGARISSNSYGSTAYSQSAYDAIAAAGRAGHLFVAAAGNDGSNNDSRPFYPCSYDLDNIISVASFDWYTQLSSFSNYGAKSVDLAAPGESIYSTFPPSTYKYWQGTSMACPHVAGTAALVLSHTPGLSPVQIKSRILSAVEKRDWFTGKLSTGGYLNVYRSLGIPWLDVTPTTGEIAPGESAVVRVAVDAKALSTGFTETCNLDIESDDPNNPSVSVPVTLSVNTYVWMQHNTPLANTEDTVGPYNVDAYVGATSLDESSMAVYWNTTGSGTFNRAPMTRIDTASGLCRGQIPGQPVGTTVYYYIFAGDTAGHTASHPVGAPSSLHRFEVLADTAPPVIEHTPLADTGSVGPYQVCAAVTDQMGIASATLHWRRNEGAFYSTPMSKSGAQYCANIPGPGRFGDTFCYYITAIDASARQNSGVSPGGAPGEVNRFSVVQCGVDTLGDMSASSSGTALARGNAFQCTSGAYLTKIEQFLTLTSPSRVTFYVYESAEQAGTYVKIHENTISMVGGAGAWIGSGPISVELVAGRFYIIGAAWEGTARYYFKSTGHPINTRFGVSKFGYSSSGYPPGATTFSTNDSYVYLQRLSICEGTRFLTLTSPDGGERYESADLLRIRWSGGGAGWTAGDTVRLESSADGGTTWSAIAGAANIPYDLGSFDWNTQGAAESPNYRIRVTCNGDPAVGDASNEDFAIQHDDTPPTITHTPIANCANLTGPYRVCAQVRDDMGIGSVTLYWSRNRSPFTATQMSASGSAFDYCADIPGPSAAGDRYCYYIEAVDNSDSGNTARSPQEGPAAPHCFEIGTCGTEEIGSQSQMTSVSGSSLGNVFACTSDSLLTNIEYDLGIDASTQLRFFVYESESENGTFSRVHETIVPSSGSGLKWYGSGPIEVEMSAGRYYITGASWQGSCMYFSGGSHPVTTAFGRSVGGFTLGTYQPPATVGNPNSPMVVNERLSVCQVERRLRIVAPNGGQAYETGNKVQIQWMSHGRYWQSGDTVRLECSADGGTTWIPIPGADSLPHDMPFFDWDTTGAPESAQYRVKVAYTGDPAVADASDGDFIVMSDVTPPAITHTPLSDTNLRAGPYRICAQVTDVHGVGAVTLHWRKDRGEFATLPMVPSGGSDQYCADIPGPGVVGAKYQYYIEASDISAAHNTSRHPSGAPESLNSFTITPCRTDTLGGTASTGSGTRYVRGNVYECTSTLDLNQIEQYLTIATSAELRFSVYESASLVGSYTKIHETVVPVSGTGQKWYGSGPISVQLVAGRSYIITAACGGLATYYSVSGGHPVTLNFGQSRSSYQSNIYPPRAAASNPSNPAIYYQRLSTCTPTEPLIQAKCSTDGETAVLSDVIVSAVFADRFYVQKADRSSGTGILWAGAMPTIGDHVDIVGVTTTIDHERLIDAASVQVTAIGLQPEPIAMTNYRLGGNDQCFSPGPPLSGQKGFEGAIGLNNIGLLVTTWGKVNGIGDGYVYIDDGSALRDGSDVCIGLRVICNPTGYSVGDYVQVTGISSCFSNPSGNIGRRILVRSPEDMHKIN